MSSLLRPKPVVHSVPDHVLNTTMILHADLPTAKYCPVLFSNPRDMPISRAFVSTRGGGEAHCFSHVSVASCLCFPAICSTSLSNLIPLPPHLQLHLPPKEIEVFEARQHQPRHLHLVAFDLIGLLHVFGDCTLILIFGVWVLSWEYCIDCLQFDSIMD